MRTLPTTKFLLLSSVLAVFLQQTALAQDHAAKIQEVLALAQKYRQFNGSALVAENGKVVYKGAFGSANMEWNIPNMPDTKFRLGSITKQFTATVILQLVEQGKIKLDGKLSDYLPDYRKDVGEKVTIHHLLTHTSGIPSYTSQPRFFENVSRNPYKVDEFVNKYASGNLEFEPGSKFLYNNSGYFLLGAIIEHDHHDTVIAKRAAGYIKTTDGYANAPYLDMSIPYAAGSLYSTVEDLFLWDQALYTDKLLSAKSKALMYTPFLDSYAYGWVITNAGFKQNNEDVQVITHGGGINGFTTTIVRFPKEKNLIVMLDNTNTEYLDRLSNSITKIIYNQPYEPPKISIVSILENTIREKGIEAGIAQYRDLKDKQAATHDFSEPELNRLGYQLLRTGKPKEAIEIFKLNVEAYPQSFNTYDSLAEAYMTINERNLAIQNYKKSLELKPNNTTAAQAIKRLENQR